MLIVLEEPDLVTENNRSERVIDVHPNFDLDTSQIEASSLVAMPLPSEEGESEEGE